MIRLDVTMPRLFSEGVTELQVQFTLPTGSLTALVGPSGSGKTTLLRLLAGLETPKRGQIEVNDSLWLDTDRRINLAPQQRSIGYVFQDTALFPNMTVLENIQFVTPPHSERLLDQLIQETGLEPFIRQKPAALSGGQRQRVALARALIRRPALLLLDEPFAALDPVASQQLRQLVLKLHNHWGTTTLLVSHYETDVRVLADRVIRLTQGRIQSDQPVLKTLTGSPQSEQIRSISFDNTQQEWVVETDTLSLRSTNPAWSQLKVNDFIQLTF
ncbi:ATP-binding cassette domain-containing protein [Spirosoma sp. SC4-14]|uniref:ATP-binding cassette domain-containing protein n=1 Tax=Spirosoma sp. SC4-14 TaxID=3128900 RepID=UPI0030D3BF4D